MSSPGINLEPILSKAKLDLCDIQPVLEKNWILAFSGGADSTLALHILLALHKTFPLSDHFFLQNSKRKLTVYFLDHGDQTPEEAGQRKQIIDRNLQKAQAICPDISLEFRVFRRDMKGICQRINGNFEFVSGRMRRRHLGMLMQKNPGSVIVTGHSMSDWFETLLMRMNRGSSLERLYPFLPFESHQGIEYSDEFSGIKYFRPLVLLTAEEIRQTCKDLSLEFWSDPSNFNGSNSRAKIRSRLTIENPDGFRKTTRNFFIEKRRHMEMYHSAIKNFEKEIIMVSPAREYRVKREFYLNLGAGEKKILTENLLQRLKLWPVSSVLLSAALQNPFQYKTWSIEIENWSDQLYVVFRRGRKNLPVAIMLSANSATLAANLVTKKHFIKMPYGRKSVKKILGEKKLSARQRKSLPLAMSLTDPLEILSVPLSCFGLKDMQSFQGP